MNIHKLDFWTSHHQFYIADSLSPFRTGSDTFWTEKAVSERLAIEDGIIGIGTECYGDVKGDLEVLETVPSDQSLDRYDHVVEGSLSLKSGILEIFPCTSNEPILQLNLQAGTYRIRVYSSNLASVDGDSGDDYYQVKIWPCDWSERNVLKNRS